MENNKLNTRSSCILSLHAMGINNRNIANILNITQNRVKYILNNECEKHSEGIFLYLQKVKQDAIINYINNNSSNEVDHNLITKWIKL